MILMSNFSSYFAQLPLGHRPHISVDLAPHLSPLSPGSHKSAGLEAGAGKFFYLPIIPANLGTLFVNGTHIGCPVKEHASQVVGNGKHEPAIFGANFRDWLHLSQMLQLVILLRRKGDGAAAFGFTQAALYSPDARDSNFILSNSFHKFLLSLWVQYHFTIF